MIRFPEASDIRRRARRATIAASLLVGVLVVAPAPGDETNIKATKPCVRTGERELMRGARVIVARRGFELFTPCDRRTKRRVSLRRFDRGPDFVEQPTQHIWVGGPFVLYEARGNFSEEDYAALNVRDVRRRTSGGVTLMATDGHYDPYVYDAVIDAQGNVAAIVGTDYQYVVIVCPYHGCVDARPPKPQVVDSRNRADPSQIELRSLTRHGAMVSWRSGGQAHQASLTG